METCWVPPWPQHTGFYWITFSGLDSSFLHVNGFLPKSLTVMIHPLTHDYERFVKLHTRKNRECWLNQDEGLLRRFIWNVGVKPKDEIPRDRTNVATLFFFSHLIFFLFHIRSNILYTTFCPFSDLYRHWTQSHHSHHWQGVNTLESYKWWITSTLTPKPLDRLDHYNFCHH